MHGSDQPYRDNKFAFPADRVIESEFNCLFSESICVEKGALPMIDREILLEHMKTSPYKPMIGVVRQAQMLTEKEKFFRIELEGKTNLAHEPGQFVMVSIFGYGEAPISISSSPSDKGFFDLTVRNVGVLTNKMHQLKAG